MTSAPCSLPFQYLALLFSELVSFPGRLSPQEAKVPPRSSKFTWFLGAHKVRNRESPSFIEFIRISPTPKILSSPARTSGSITVPREWKADWPAWIKWLPKGRWEKIHLTEGRRKTSENDYHLRDSTSIGNIYGLLTACMVLKILGNLEWKLKVLVLRDFKDLRYDGI